MADVQLLPSTIATAAAPAASNHTLVRRNKSASRRSARRRISEEGLGVWTRVEHERFLEGKRLFPDGPWKLVAEFVGTRNTRQTMTHAQKYRQKLERRQRGLRTTRRVSDDKDMDLTPELYYSGSPRATLTTTTGTAPTAATPIASALETVGALSSPVPPTTAVSPLAQVQTRIVTFEQLLMDDLTCVSTESLSKLAPIVETTCSPTHHADTELPWLDECLDYLILNLQ